MKDKIFYKITGIILIVLSIVMFAIVIYLWNTDEEMLVIIASLYVALTISIIIFIIGYAFLTTKHTTTIHVIENNKDDKVKKDV